MKIKILDAKTLGDDIDLTCFNNIGDVEIFATTSPDETIARTKNAEIIITNKVVFDKNILQQLPNLKLICLTATGFNNIDLEAAKENNIAVTNVSGYSTNSVAQHTFASLLYLLQNLKYYDEFVKNGSWSNNPIFTHIGKPWYEINNKRWGIIGLGNIGKQVANIASSFGAEVVYFSTSGKNHNKDFKSIELDKLLKTCDIVSIHAPLNEATNNLIDAHKLKLMQKESILINVGRGGIVNESDLADAIDNNILRGACVDVISSEPMPSNNPLANIKNKENILITPHIAWASSEARETCIKEVFANIEAFLSQTNRNRLV